MRPRVAHVIQCVSRGGAGRALAFLTRALTDFEHVVVSLDPAPDHAAVAHELASADIVHVHFWNTPELYELLGRELPPMRMLLWPHVGGASAPHVLTPALVRHADVTVASTPYTLELPGLGGLPYVPATAGFERVRHVEPVPHHGFNVGYVGTVDFAKMHPDFVAMSAAVDVPGVRFQVYGAGRAVSTLAEQAEELDVADRFEFHGWVDDLGAALGSLDVLGYPLREDNYSATELVLQEAAYAGLPAVVLRHGGAARTVEHGRTGLIATDEHEYARCIERLYHSPELRRRLSDGAGNHARLAWAPDAIAARWRDVYGRLLAAPKTDRAPLFGDVTGAALFVRTLGDRGAPFARSLATTDEDDLLEADDAIADSPPALVSAGAGGILHYRRRYPDDPDLSRWAGLVLLRLARAAVA